jgi:hypothetical protein
MLKKILKLLVFYSSFNHYFICCALYFQDQIKAKIAEAINAKVTKVSFAEADLSLFKNFPNANVTLEN